MTSVPIPAGFMEAILTTPEDDTPRMILADYLEERDDPRGEFIRVQCELAKHYSPVHNENNRGDKRWESWVQRERQLLDGKSDDCWHRVLWTGVPGLLNIHANCRGYEFTRGFVSSITWDAANFLKYADDLYWHPDQERPRPDGAQPIEEVTLFSYATLEQLRKRQWKSVDNLAGLRRQLDEVFAVEWPRIRFKRLVNNLSVHDMSELNSLLEQIANQAAEGVLADSPFQPWRPLAVRDGGPIIPRQSGFLINSIH